MRLAGVWGSSAPMLGGAIAAMKQAPVLYVCTHLDDADAAIDDIEVLTGVAARLFPAMELEVPGGEGATANHVSDESVAERLRLCSDLAGGMEGPSVIVAPVAAIIQPVPSPAALAAARLRLERGEEIGPEALAEWLVSAGFDPVEQIDQQGEFTRRGGIVDIFPPGAPQPVRVEFFGDTVESLRRFDPDTQRSTDEIDGFDLLATAAGKETDPSRTTMLADLLPPETIVVISEPAEVASLGETFYRRLVGGTDKPVCGLSVEQTAGKGHGQADDACPCHPGPAAGVFEPAEVFAALGKLTVVELHPFKPGGGEGPLIDLGIRSLQRIEANTDEALSELEALSRDNEVWVYCENSAERDRFVELISQNHPELAKKARTGIGHVNHAFHWPGERLVVVGHHEVFHRYAHPRRLRRVRTGRPIDSFVDLQEGDYVVHVAHGIARFEGLRQLEKAGRKEEYLTLAFADSALLHVPVTEIQLVQKYIGARRGHPTLSKLGGTGWAARKKRVEEAVTDMAAELLRVQAMRAASPGIAYDTRTEWQGKFEGEFQYTETADQLSTMQQVYEDMARPRPMDRLLCGDVGYGKTELAMRAAFCVANAGKQVAVLVPTTVLAAQHHRTFRERFADYPLNVEMISRFRSKGEQAWIVEATARGAVDILIGTHRLLSPDVQFADLGLVVIDEEQRFGVEHKERLKGLRATVEVLTMTATPIPRTLHMALLGLRDISNLTTPPLDRRAIYTEVCHVNDERMRAAILRELARDGQVFFVHNRVQDIQAVAEHVRAVVPEARIAIGHGQMPEHELEKTMLRFVRGEVDVLVCTTIIESGLDIPTANTMFIHEADRLGLAQLHQLRGRIGRYKNRAYCYLLLPTTRPVNRVAAKRLKAVEEFSDLGAGFAIAMRDLEIRGAGNILGPEQSGHIAAVGYELYCQLLETAVHKLRGEQVHRPRRVHVELGVDAYIPRSYIGSSRQRMEAYRRLAACQAPDDITQLQRDLLDAYGKVPAEVDALLMVAEIRVRAGMLGFDSIVLMPPDVIFAFTDVARADRALEGLAGSVRLADRQTAHWRPPKPYLEHPTLLTVLRRHLNRAMERV